MPRPEKILRDDIEDLRHEIKRRLPNADEVKERDWYIATTRVLRDRLADQWRAQERHSPKKRVCYLSIEYLLGRLFFDVLVNLDMVETVGEALAREGVDLDTIRALEAEPGLGSGGLGRLAACLVESMASLEVPAIAYGIRYEKGFFVQRLADGWQEELSDDWLAAGNPWEVERRDIAFPVSFGGFVEYVGQAPGPARGIWYPSETVIANCYDTPIAGWRARHINTLRLWSARVSRPGGTERHEGDAARAAEISQSLYPSEATAEGKELRLRQEYFFTSASLQDIVQRQLREAGNLERLPDSVAIQLNDTHPALAVSELMRILVDEHDLSWERAWSITTSALNYTNHTLLPEALERWPVELLNRLLPRHLQIIYLINWLHLEEIRRRGFTDPAIMAAASIIEEGSTKYVRMGHLAFIGSHKVNGVSALHTELMRHKVFSVLESTASRPRIVNKTNGISFRRWLIEANRPLTKFLARHIGRRFYDDSNALEGLQSFASNPAFMHGIAQVRLDNKKKLATRIRDLTGVIVDPRSLFDVHIKRIHEYKRQLLNILEIIALYNEMRAEPSAHLTPRVKIFAGKAAPDYTRAHLIIKLVHDVGRMINNDAAIGDRLKVIFLPNYSVSLAESIIPAADLSEQISTAGMEASGTGNMKLALNGALTIGTFDGANIEIRDHVGTENVFMFGSTAEQIEEKRRAGLNGSEILKSSSRLAAVVDAISGGTFSPEEPERFLKIVETLRGYDHFMVAADFDAYWDAQRAIDALWNRQEAWWEKSILNTARMGWFSADRTIRDYARDIWNMPAEP